MKKVICLTVCLLFLIITPVFAVDKSKDDWGKLEQTFEKIRQIEQRLDNREYDSAISICDNIIADLDKVSKNISPSLFYYYRGKAYEGKLLLDNAILDYNKAIEVNPYDFDDSIISKVYIGRADAYAKKGFFTEAVADYNKNIEIYPVNYDNVITVCNNILAINPENAEAYYNRGYAYFSKNLLEEAITDYSKAIALNPDYYAAYNSRGAAYFKSGFINNAIADYSKAIEISPAKFGAYYNRANAYFEKKLYDEAIADYSAVIALKPETFEYITDHGTIISINPAFYAYYGRGNAYAKKNLLDKAVADYNETIKTDPRDISAYSKRGNIYLKKKRYDKANDDYNKVSGNSSQYSSDTFFSYKNFRISFFPPPTFFKYIVTDNNIAYLGKTLLNKALEIDYKNASIYPYLERAEYHINLGRYDDAIADYSKFLKNDIPEYFKKMPKDYARVYRDRGKIHERKGLLDKAIADYSHAIEIVVKNDNIGFSHNIDKIYSNRARVYLKKNLFDKAIADYSQAIKFHPLSDEDTDSILDMNLGTVLDGMSFFSNYYSRGNAYLKKKLYDNAIADFSKIIEIDPSGSAYIDYFNNIKGIESYNLRGLAYLKKGIYQEAYTDFAKHIELEPRGLAAYYHRALTCEKLKRDNDAAKDYLMFLKFAPPGSKDRANAEKRIFAEGFLDKAIANYSRAIEIDANNAENYFYRGSAYEKKDFLNEAIADYSRAVEIAPQDYRAYYSRGQAYFKKKFYDEAIADYDAAIEIIHPEKDRTFGNSINLAYLKYQDAVIVNCRGLAYLEKGLYQEAIDDFTMVIEWCERRNASEVFTAYYNRALTCEKLNRSDDVIKDYLMFLKLAPAGDEKIPYVKKRLSFFVDNNKIEI